MLHCILLVLESPSQRLGWHFFSKPKKKKLISSAASILFEEVISLPRDSTSEFNRDALKDDLKLAGFDK